VAACFPTYRGYPFLSEPPFPSVWANTYAELDSHTSYSQFSRRPSLFLRWVLFFRLGVVIFFSFFSHAPLSLPFLCQASAKRKLTLNPPLSNPLPLVGSDQPLNPARLFLYAPGSLFSLDGSSSFLRATSPFLSLFFFCSEMLFGATRSRVPLFSDFHFPRLKSTLAAVVNFYAGPNSAPFDGY